jgi:mannose-1-phosphate guanylyltransferase
MSLVAQYKPEIAAGLETIAAAWDLGEEQRQAALAEVWPKLEKIPIDNAIAEPAALEGKVAVVPSNFGVSFYCVFP